MHFHAKSLLTPLSQLPSHRNVWIAYSGGLDSHVLLHALVQIRAQLKGTLRAIHVHHGLSPNADHWVAHCRSVCEALKVPLTIEKVELDGDNGESLEAQAREARYRVFAEALAKDDVLLTAHHQDDQVETMLLQLLRGGGPRGLAAMPLYRPLGKGWLARPLLDVPRAALQHYAEQAWLNWEDDESNDELRFERNYLRHQVVPVLKRQWPALEKVMGRSASHFAEASELMDELAKLDLDHCKRDEGEGLPLKALDGLARPRQKNLLRYWLREQQLILPDTIHLERILDEVVPAREDAAPLVNWRGGEVRRYRDVLYAMPPLAAPPAQPINWDGKQTIELPQALGSLHVEQKTGQGIKVAAGQAMTIRFRQGGERCQPLGRREHHSLKKLFQEQGIPPWQRDRMPLIYVNDELAQVGNLFVCEPFQAEKNVPGKLILWSDGQING